MATKVGEIYPITYTVPTVPTTDNTSTGGSTDAGGISAVGTGINSWSYDEFLTWSESVLVQQREYNEHVIASQPSGKVSLSSLVLLLFYSHSHGHVSYYTICMLYYLTR